MIVPGTIYTRCAQRGRTEARIAQRIERLFGLPFDVTVKRVQQRFQVFGQLRAGLVSIIDRAGAEKDHSRHTRCLGCLE